MSNTESIIVGQTKTSSWRKSDTTWTLGLFGTAIGAGVLFFPIRAGFGGLIPILLMLVLAFPIAFYCHRALARLCLSGSNVSGNITETVEEHFGKTGGVVITFLYFFAICPLLYDLLGKPAPATCAEPRRGGAVPAAADGLCYLVW